MLEHALAESTFAGLKNELVSRHSWRTKAATRSAIFEYIEGWWRASTAPPTSATC
ncbi:IS3 family transposase [Streptomyces sp. NBC_01006]|uniref:IS3 family transposase n=1 Tax=Streptomyces sp. NBC_01006 TaxID=2903716 RepID=UPI003863AA33|nr:hypothetical protein OG509_01740 [Streptomyces sp. NBC_01006]